MANSGETVVVTGASGYIAAHVCDQFLKRGLGVVGTVRSADKGAYLASLWKKYGDKFRYVVVPDMQVEGCFDEAASGCQGFIHVASPFFTENVTDPMAQLVEPALKGTRNALTAAQKAGCKRVVLTSSFAAVYRGSQPLPYLFTERDWNTDSKPEDGGDDSYMASKTLAEKSAWEFVKASNVGFDLVTMNPPLVVGPAIHNASLTSLNTSLEMVHRYVSGHYAPDTIPKGGMGFVHVVDLAIAHVLAYTTPSASNNRFLISDGVYSWQQVCDMIRAEYPALRDVVPVGKPREYPILEAIDNTKSKTELGMSYRGMKAILKESVDQFLTMKGTGPV
ncbi:3-beta hydroxysteroid dehydrogenase/isomerase family protein [Gonapodya prolifera JEL478]|uniref:3-beta hydroxysteroid dehydrogenase/isomerase family protein n=1 Tax=Gonapodya prolifera (strain JEL478) TaxID=1344416 RepID=A0A139ALI0_GONPJ|nr:3-beta hydroxysteroid dehydrogenase/isomerase family protein [Gonapodya prolifera JEL478]|eukprot:KXS17652.1 3-beta hydroxysteroid dehydrogenase/isomerase family protein [Gonapodya prolifera JEL478]